MAGTLQDFKADLFRALANPVRIRLLELLRSEGELSVNELHLRAGVEPSNVSQHLSILRRHGLVATIKDGTSVRYSIAAPHLFEILDAARALFEERLVEQSRLLKSDG